MDTGIYGYTSIFLDPALARKLIAECKCVEAISGPGAGWGGKPNQQRLNLVC